MKVRVEGWVGVVTTASTAIIPGTLPATATHTHTHYLGEETQYLCVCVCVRPKTRKYYFFSCKFYKADAGWDQEREDVTMLTFFQSSDTDSPSLLAEPGPFLRSQQPSMWLTSNIAYISTSLAFLYSACLHRAGSSWVSANRCKSWPIGIRKTTKNPIKYHKKVLKLIKLHNQNYVYESMFIHKHLSTGMHWL